MTQQEAEGLMSILKRRKGEEVTLIEQKWEAERQKLEADRKHTLNRLHEKSGKLQQALVNAKDETFKARGTEAWKEKKLAEKTASQLVVDHHREISEMNRYYQNEFKALRDKRDEDLRNLNRFYSEERARIALQIDKKPKEEQLNYWKQKFYRAAEEIKELKKKITDAA